MVPYDINRRYGIYSVFHKSDAKIEITITATNLIRIRYPLSSCNYHLSGANVANFNKIHCTVFEQQVVAGYCRFYTVFQKVTAKFKLL